MSETGVWLSLRLRDEPAMIAFLTAVGFTALAMHHDDDGRLEHGELVWPAGGGLMVGSERESSQWPQVPGTQAAYLVVADPDATFAAALAAGATTLAEPSDKPYGRDGSVRDPDGNLWSFGTYAPGD
jgi:uncharacterized glyoxalase superfamily protein PhnB